MTDSSADSRGSTLFTAWVAAVSLAVIPPLWLAVALASPEQSMRLLRHWARRLIALSGCPLRISGTEHLPADSCGIIVANHSSYLDSVALLAALTVDFRFVANRRELARPFVSLILRKGHHLIVDQRSKLSRVQCAQAMLDTLAQGRSLVLFPEGTRSATGLHAFRNGAFRAAMKSGRPIIPVAISGTSCILPRRFRLLRRGTIHIQILPPIDPGAASTDPVGLRRRTVDAIAGALNV